MLTLPLSLWASLVKVEGCIILQHKLLGPLLLFSSPDSDDRQAAAWPLENTRNQPTMVLNEQGASKTSLHNHLRYLQLSVHAD